MDKTCARCGETKPVSAFGVNRATEDELHINCRDCVRAYARERREKSNANRPPEWKKKTADKRAYQRQWRADHPGYATERSREWYRLHPERRRVRGALRWALRTGQIQKWPCQVCGDPESHGHHPDYSAPLDVVWLCADHHRATHDLGRELGAGR